MYTGVDPNQSVLQVERGQRDYDLLGVPAAANARLARQHGVNRRGGRYRVDSLIEVDYLALNTRRGPFRSARLRRAVNYAVDRTGLTAQIGPYAGARRPDPAAHDAGVPARDGRSAQAGPRSCAGPRGWRARRRHAVLPGGSDRGQPGAVIRRDLARIGLTVKLERALSTCSSSRWATRARRTTWCSSASRPIIRIRPTSSTCSSEGSPSRREQSERRAFDSPEFNRKLAAAARLTGPRRLESYGRLDVEIMREAAPWVPIANRTQREFISGRVGCYTPWGAYGFMSLATACLSGVAGSRADSAISVSPRPASSTSPPCRRSTPVAWRAAPPRRHRPHHRQLLPHYDRPCGARPPPPRRRRPHRRRRADDRAITAGDDGTSTGRAEPVRRALG